jgi:2-succinyl-5-enolpyruvyl-6-hydroxy-3-cyclohexene-1-carboxylate synthase
VQHAVVCPGSRSTPLALACAEHRDLRTWSVIDERSAAFFALGVGKATGRPALVVATSGTAGAHFYPAVIEAGMMRVPLVLLTADRPPELRDWGAAQTIDQRALYGAHARLWLDVGMPEASAPVLVHLRAQVGRAMAAALRAPEGAVHLNVPFREPLAPVPDAPPLDLGALAERGREGAPFTRLVLRSRAPDAAELSSLADRLERTEKGVIVCGPRDRDDGLDVAVGELGKILGYPVLAEATSNVRFAGCGEALCAYDAVLRNERFARAHRPEVVLRVGGGLTPKGPQAWLDRSGAFTVQVGDGEGLVDPQHSASVVLEGDPVAACRALLRENARPQTTDWYRHFIWAEMRARQVMGEVFAADDRLTEPRIAREVVAAMPPGAMLFLSSSMPIRDVDAFAMERTGPLRVLANRGANGIDGVTSTALGAAMALGKPAALLTGDLAFLHDLSGLLIAARHKLSLAVVVVNNDGGGIFSFLPIAGRTPHFETLFATPHGLPSLRPAAELFGARHHEPGGARELAEAVRAGAKGGLHVIEARVDRAANWVEHRALFERISRGLEDGPWR